MDNAWKTIFSCITGSLHEKLNKPCEDWTRRSEWNNNIVVTMSDGASSALCAQHGSRLTCMSAKQWLVLHFEELISLPDNDIEERIKKELFPYIIQQIHDNRRYYPYTTDEDYAATLLFVISDGHRFISGNLGDGLVGTRLPNGHLEVLLGPENRRWKNRTWHIVTEDSIKHLRILIGSVSAGQTFFLMTDGAQDCLYEIKSRKFAPLMETLCSWLDQPLHERTISMALEIRMSELFPQRTTDDCALSIFKYLPL